MSVESNKMDLGEGEDVVLLIGLAWLRIGTSVELL
jgi:hypothetical protein